MQIPQEVLDQICAQPPTATEGVLVTPESNELQRAIDHVTAIRAESATARSYATLRPADAVAHLGERIASEIDSFERETSLRVAAIKLKREKETETLLKAQCHVRS